MAEITQFTFGLPEVTEALIKKQGVREGKLAVEFNLNVGFMGMTPENVRPGVMVLANTLQLVRAQEGTPAHLIVDAAEVNPATS